MVSSVKFASTNLKMVHKHYCRIKVFLILSIQFILVQYIDSSWTAWPIFSWKYFIWAHTFCVRVLYHWYSLMCTLMFSVKLGSKQEHHYIHWKDTIAKFNNSSYKSHYFCANTVTVAELVLMAVLSVTNVGSVNWFQSVFMDTVDSI